MSDTNRFLTMAITGYKGHGLDGASGQRLLPVRRQRHLSKLAGRHSYKFGGDYRKIGVKSLNYGASTGSCTFTGTFSGNAIADLMLGYPQSGNIPLNNQLNGYVNYSAGYVQDDWRVNDKLTLNYGVRFEETGLREANNQFTVGFDQTSVSPLNATANVIDPVTGARRTILGGLQFAGVNGAPTEQGQSARHQRSRRASVRSTASPRRRCCALAGVSTTRRGSTRQLAPTRGQHGFAATTDVPQSTGSVPTVSMSNPFPAGLVQPSGSSLGLLTGTGGTIQFVGPNKGAPRVQQWSADLQRELPMGMSLTLNYTGLAGADLGWGGTANTLININQLDPNTGARPGLHDRAGREPVLRCRRCRSVRQPGHDRSRSAAPSVPAVRRHQHDAVDGCALDVQRGHRPDPQAQHRSLGWSGRLHLQPSEGQPVRSGQLLLVSPWPAEQLHRDPGLGLLQPGSGVRPQPARLAAQADHRTDHQPAVRSGSQDGVERSGERTGGRLVGHDGHLVPERLPDRDQPERHRHPACLFGGTLRPNLVSGADFLVAGDVTDRIRANTSDNLYLNAAAFSATPLNAFGNAPRTLPGIRSPWRNNVDLSVSKNVKTGGSTNASIRLEVLNVFNQVQWAALASNALGNASFGQITNQANNMRMVQATVRFQF